MAEQKDFVRSKTDVAIQNVRDFQGGKVGSKQVAESLKTLTENELLVVCIGSRVPLSSLKALRETL